MLMFSFLFEFLNILLLFGKTSVASTLGSYFSLSIIIYLQKMYYSVKIGGDKTYVLKDVFSAENTPIITWHDKDTTFYERSFVCKV